MGVQSKLCRMCAAAKDSILLRLMPVTQTLARLMVL